MKKLLSSFILLFVAFVTFAQSGTKVKWTQSIKKIGDKKYEVRLIAAIQPGFHLYSQDQSSDAIALPATVTFIKNPLVTLTGKTKEEGKLYDQFDKATNSRSRFYSNKVEFVQVVTVRSNIKTSISGEVQYMVCDDKQCLPPDKFKFSVTL